MDLSPVGLCLECSLSPLIYSTDSDEDTHRRLSVTHTNPSRMTRDKGSDIHFPTRPTPQRLNWRVSKVRTLGLPSRGTSAPETMCRGFLTSGPPWDLPVEVPGSLQGEKTSDGIKVTGFVTDCFIYELFIDDLLTLT